MPALSPSLRLVPAGPPPAARRRWRVAAASLALHLVLVALLLLIRPREQGDVAAGPSYELLFQPEGAPEVGNAPPAAAAPAPPQPDSLPGPQTPEPESTPDMAAPPSPASPAAPEVPPQPTAPPLPAPAESPVARQLTPEAPAAPPPLPQAPEAEVSTPRAEASVRLAQPEPPPAPALPRLPEFVPPTPPPPLPAPRVAAPRAAPAPSPTPRMAPPPGTFANPMDLSFGTGPSRPAAPRLAARPGSVASRSLDLATGAARAPNRQEAYFDARAARLGADWKDGLEGYWLRHRYYPRQAAEAGEDGQVQIELTVNRYGKVEAVTVQGRSGSPWLDLAAQAVWRGAQLAPLPAEVAGDRITFSITINYILLR